MVLAPWENGVLVEFGPILDVNNIEYEYGVTAARIVIDNQANAASETNTTAFIASKSFSIEPSLVLNPAFGPQSP